MNTWHGYTGKVLDVDLTAAVVSEAGLDRSLAEGYMGGKGFGAKILYDQLPPGCEPHSADNILVFATGPLTGTLAPSSGRFEV
jgi:aldehyde:ferredoxin oxidoreductase